ncbi:MAG TPA: acylphosphatase [Chloroflexia bacterium]|nr:acylphosphatase [Chloroflexia bacterium]
MEDATGNAPRLLALVAIVRGRVQNVGFRVFVYEAARRLGLRGYVRNSPEGNVEVVAYGERGRLDVLLGQLHRGPVAARVDDVEYEWQHRGSDDFPGGFEVRA